MPSILRPEEALGELFEPMQDLEPVAQGWPPNQPHLAPLSVRMPVTLIR